jgi:DNA repair protein RadC
MSENLFVLHEIQTRYVPRPDLGQIPPETLAAVATPEGAIKIAKRFLRGLEVEHVIAILLSSGLRALSVDIVSKGTIDQAIACPRDIYREAVRHNAVAVIMAHNHPSGTRPQPSDADIATTKRVKAAGDILGIRLLDHVICGGGPSFSFARNGLL